MPTADAAQYQSAYVRWVSKKAKHDASLQSTTRHLTRVLRGAQGKERVVPTTDAAQYQSAHERWVSKKADKDASLQKQPHTRSLTMRWRLRMQ